MAVKKTAAQALLEDNAEVVAKGYSKANEPRTIFVALSNVQKSLSEQGISKDGVNKFDKYKFRGIDQVLNAMAPILAEEGVLIIPSITKSTTEQVPTKNGGTQNHSVVYIDYTLYDRSGDSITHRAIGEAMDRGDKSINKAMSAAFKYFLFQTFCIPLQGSDADSESHEIVAAVAPPQTPPTFGTASSAASGAVLSQSMAHAAFPAASDLPPEHGRVKTAFEAIRANLTGAQQ